MVPKTPSPQPKLKQESTDTTKGSIALGDAESFHPDYITLSTFRNLLSYYPKTVEQVRRNKLLSKLQSKSKGAKGKADKKANATILQSTELEPSQQAHVDAEVEKFVELDQWRYEDMPRITEERKASDEEVVNKDDLVTVMEWKT